MAVEQDLADLQAQIVALRLAVEGAWLSLLSPSPDPTGDARRLGEQNAAAISVSSMRAARRPRRHGRRFSITRNNSGAVSPGS
ncbi:hypothetical protein [uncultured Sphingomonas sp.]|uniref:hypothetical protein n=1 Tax=uncultured Sphingomonas sp. TaxID=158754 RepID=UPI0035C94D8D